jgi:hypothetical protein
MQNPKAEAGKQSRLKSSDVTFKDVAGMDRVKIELEEATSNRKREREREGERDLLDEGFHCVHVPPP